jgi:predicted transcriptional regulator/DNA-binding XRE family transcriptional regulator
MRKSAGTARSVSADPSVPIGRRLKLVREAAGLSQSSLAEQIGMHQAALSRLEQQDDLLVSTMATYLKGVGASLEMFAQLNGEAFILAKLLAFETATPAVIDAESRDVVFSIKPQYSECILDGAKTVELRRRFPAKIAPGTLAFIYTTTPIRALTGVVEIEGVVKHSPGQIWKEFSKHACISRSQFRAYFAGVPSAFAIKLRHARRLRRPIELAELRERFSFEPPQSFLYARPQLREALQYECAQISHRHERLHRS